MKRKVVKKVNTKKSILILLLLATFAIISTYAWFTSNRLVKITSMNVHVNASQGFQISLDAVNWKTVIQATDINAVSYVGSNNHVPDPVTGLLDPMSTAAETLATNGYMRMFKGEAKADDADDFVISAEETPETSAAGYIAFDLFFKTNQQINLAIEKNAGVFDIATENARKKKGMENAARVAFVEQGNVPPSFTGSPTEVAVEARGKISTKRDGTNVTIWEPNFNSHTEAARTEMYNMFNYSTNPADTRWTNKQPYDGISEIIPAADPDATPDPILPTYLRRNGIAVNTATANGGAPTGVSDPKYFKQILANFITTAGSANGTTLEGTALVKDEDLEIKLEAGITKFRIYMWIEGQDWDCYDSASGSDIQWNLSITTVDGTTPTP